MVRSFNFRFKAKFSLGSGLELQNSVEGWSPNPPTAGGMVGRPPHNVELHPRFNKGENHHTLHPHLPEYGETHRTPSRATSHPPQTPPYPQRKGTGRSKATHRTQGRDRSHQNEHRPTRIPRRICRGCTSRHPGNPRRIPSP